MGSQFARGFDYQAVPASAPASAEGVFPRGARIGDRYDSRALEGLSVAHDSGGEGQESCQEQGASYITQQVFDALKLVSRATLGLGVAAFVCQSVMYNLVYLRRVAPIANLGPGTLSHYAAFNTAWALAVWCYVKTHITDAGSVPPRWYDFVQGVGKRLPVAHANGELLGWQDGKATFCEKCYRARPARAHHCLICGICVLRMDHHCPWINNCVGFYNHKHYILLLVYTFLLSAITAAMLIPGVTHSFNVVVDPGGEIGMLSQRSDAIAVMVYFVVLCGIAVWLCCLLRSTISLAVQNTTTIEAHYDTCLNPYDQGHAVRNLEQIFGVFGIDWFFPVEPWQPVTDGVSFPRAAQGFTDVIAEGGTRETAAEAVWRCRYQVPQRMEVSSDSPRSAATDEYANRMPFGASLDLRNR